MSAGDEREFMRSSNVLAANASPEPLEGIGHRPSESHDALLVISDSREEVSPTEHGRQEVVLGKRCVLELVDKDERECKPQRSPDLGVETNDESASRFSIVNSSRCGSASVVTIPTSTGWRILRRRWIL